MASIRTSHLGEIRGVAHDRVSQFLGIQYATLKDRLSPAQLVEARAGDSVLDATKDGPTAVSPLEGCDMELSLIQHSLPHKDLPQSDRDCLNLNITTPSNVSDASNLPVFVFIHGGGFMIGANSWPQFDLTRFVQLSVEKNLPVVAVSINYRLGPFGFLTSEELRNAGYKANNGLRDQRVALEWVQRHIRDFGGDPANVTLAGMSAGGASVTFHLDSHRALFRRAIIMSGTCLLIPPLPIATHEENYKQAMSALGLEDASAEERIRALLETPGQELLAKLPPSILAVPAVDGDMVFSAPAYAHIGDRSLDTPKGKAWCKDLMIGDAQMDANIMGVLMPHAKPGCAKKFVHALNTVLASQPETVQYILEQYRLTAETSDDDAFPAILNYINDIAFLAPTLTFAQGWPGNALVYYFNEENPWAGPSQGRAGHILDLAYLFQNFREFLTPEQQTVGVAFAEDCLRFCHGGQGWPAVAKTEEQDQDQDQEPKLTQGKGFSARVYGPSSQGVSIQEIQRAYGGASGRRGILFEGHQGTLDEMARVFAMFRSLS